MDSKFIVIEGLEGAGKTTARDAIVATLRARGITDLVFTASSVYINPYVADFYLRFTGGMISNVYSKSCTAFYVIEIRYISHLNISRFRLIVDPNIIRSYWYCF